MKFFTDIQTNASKYCLLNINRYNDKRKDTKKLFFIDPGVMELKKATEFKKIDLLHQLANGNLKSNEYISIDYPCDMVDRKLPKDQYEQRCHEFRDKSIANNWRYKDNPQYICTIQSYWMVYSDFEYRMKELEPIYAGKKKIVGLGNLCRLLVDRPKMNHSSDEYKYFKKVVDYIIRNKEKFYWIHIYGMSLYAIKSFVPLLQAYAPNIILTVDSTKWTQGCNNKMRKKYMKNPNQQQLIPTKHKCVGFNCSKDTRDEFFLEYIKEMHRAHVQVDY